MVNTQMSAQRTCRAIVLVVAAVVVCGVQGVIVGTVEARPATNSKPLEDGGQKAAPKTPLPALDRETEAKSLELVQSHLPELRAVLKRLRADQPRQYDRAIRDLAKSARKLEQAKTRDERLYEIEVDLLKAQNEVNLLTAKLKVRDRQSDRTRLREAAGRLHEAQIVRALYDVGLYRQRLERTQKQLDAAQERLEAKRTDTDRQLEKAYLSLLRKAGREPDTKKKPETKKN